MATDQADTTVMAQAFLAATEGGWNLSLSDGAPFRHQYTRGRAGEQSVTLTFAPTSGQLMSALIVTEPDEGPFVVSGQGLLGVVCRVLRRTWA